MEIDTYFWKIIQVVHTPHDWKDFYKQFIVWGKFCFQIEESDSLMGPFQSTGMTSVACHKNLYKIGTCTGDDVNLPGF